jgi:hypothetical protein
VNRKINVRRNLARGFGLVEQVDRSPQQIQRCVHKVRLSCFVARHHANFH